jgi:flavin-dependent dehydrogenase
MAQTLMSTGTLTLERAVANNWDAVVVGAGPGGALAARQLALTGVRTLLVERHSFPRNKVCGGCLNGRALEVLRSVGLENELNTLRPVALNRFVLQANRRRVELVLPAGAAIRRSNFDAMLVQAAIDAGAEFLPETLAVVENDDRTDLASRRVHLRQNGGSHRTAMAKVIVAADGLGHPSLQRIPALRVRLNWPPESALERRFAKRREGTARTQFIWRSRNGDTWGSCEQGTAGGIWRRHLIPQP